MLRPDHVGAERGMLFFTPEWARGESANDAVLCYDEHLRALEGGLPDHVLDLARTISLHDGLIARVRYDPKGTMNVRLRCGDLQFGYCDLELTCRELSLGRSDLRCLPGICAAPAEELLYDEFDLVDDLIVHRLLFSSWREVSFVARDLAHRVVPVGSRSFEREADELTGIHREPFGE